MAFLARMVGADLGHCRSLVDYSRRLFPGALRISGWSHAWGNVMKTIAKSHPCWPEILQACRDLCRFFRLEGWRSHLEHMLSGSDLDLSPLKSWKGSFAKWRYETIAVVFKTLTEYRHICQRGTREEFFQNF